MSLYFYTKRKSDNLAVFKKIIITDTRTVLLEKQAFKYGVVITKL